MATEPPLPRQEDEPWRGGGGREGREGGGGRRGRKEGGVLENDSVCCWLCVVGCVLLVVWCWLCGVGCCWLVFVVGCCWLVLVNCWLVLVIVGWCCLLLLVGVGLLFSTRSFHNVYIHNVTLAPQLLATSH